MARLVRPTLLLWLLAGPVVGPGGPSSAWAKDYLVTIGGGYEPEENQASLEENVLFLQRILAQHYSADRRHDVFFSDGEDPEPDLQVLAEPEAGPARPVTDLLAALHRRGGPAGPAVTYRNHRVPEVAGGNSPEAIRDALTRIAREVTAGDRLLIYVTAHGGPGGRRDPRNTTISCWNDESISVRSLAGWLNDVPAEVPVVLVMAQCYCGGFADLIFADLPKRTKLAKAVRVGFFAQQYDLPAAGCRPDIEHDLEFSSYFWGTLIGQSRSGDPLPGGDADQDGTVTFDEAFAHAVIVGKTIDMPLKASDVLLESFSRIPDHTLVRNRERRPARRDEPDDSDASPTVQTSDLPAPVDADSNATLATLAGPIRELARDASPAIQRIIKELCRQLDVSADKTFAELLEAYDRWRDERPSPRGRRRSSSGRRELLVAVGERWPELADPRGWKQSKLLDAPGQAALLAEIKQLPTYAVYEERRLQREQQSQAAEDHELREVLYRRLIDTLENAVLARNLPAVAPHEVVLHYERMLQLERSSLQPMSR
ncbi:MAG: hypothetical protein AB7F89_18565 [Pirellulaceae bacterium]